MDFISFDLETTGTLSHLDHIVEIGAVRFVEGKAQESYQQLVSISIPMPEQASAVNGITDEMLKGKPPIEEILPHFAEFCGEALLVAHNAPFDFQFLLRAIEEHHAPAPRGLVLDSCHLARRSLPGMANYKLSTLCEYLKISSGKFHRASADALHCGELFVCILKKKGLSTRDVQEIIKLSGRKPLQFPYSQLEGQMDLFD